MIKNTLAKQGSFFKSLRYLRWGGGMAKPSNQKKAQAWKLIENGADSPASGACFVGQFFVEQRLTG